MNKVWVDNILFQVDQYELNQIEFRAGITDDQ
jgi:hypothetical protein